MRTLLLCVIAMGLLLPGIQANGITESANQAWDMPLWLPTAVIIVLLLVIIVGGVKRIATFASYVVPVMATIYILAAIAILFINYDQIVDVFSSIFSSPVSPSRTITSIGTPRLARCTHSQAAGVKISRLAPATARRWWI